MNPGMQIAKDAYGQALARKNGKTQICKETFLAIRNEDPNKTKQFTKCKRKAHYLMLRHAISLVKRSRSKCRSDEKCIRMLNKYVKELETQAAHFK